MKKYILWILGLWAGTMVWAGPGLKITGKVRVLESTGIRLECLDGKEIGKVEIGKDGTFNLEIEKLQPDVYRLWIGTTCQKVYLTAGTVTVKGFYDARQVENSVLDFSGIEAYHRILRWVPAEKNQRKRSIAPEALQQLKGPELCALAYFSDLQTYEANRQLMDIVPAEDRNSLAARWLQRRLDSLEQFALGKEAFDFTLVDPQGKKVSLHDFRGKFVLIDFWASWCGPCRQEMKSLEPIYRELKGEDLEFVSISLDNRENDWRKMIETEQLPWVMLWNQEGFSKRDRPNRLQKAYGFYGIPFIVLVDKEGKYIARGLRGAKVKEAILKARGK